MNADYQYKFKEENGEYTPCIESANDTNQIQGPSCEASPSPSSPNAHVQTNYPSQLPQAVPNSVSNSPVETAAEKSLIAIEQKEAFKNIELSKIEQAEKIRADIASKRSLQHFEIFQGKSGEMFFKRQLFLEEIESCLPFSYPQPAFLINAECHSEMLLRVRLQNCDGNIRTIYLLPNSISSEKYLLRKFREQGIGMPFSREKQMEILFCFLDFLLSFTVPKEVCYTKLGWNFYENKLTYVTKKDVLWKEVSRRAS